MSAAALHHTGWYENSKGRKSHFHPNEFFCRCGSCDSRSVRVDSLLIDWLDYIRQETGAPLIISSGIRCREYNARISGAPNSYHIPRSGILLGSDIRSGSDDYPPERVYVVASRFTAIGGRGIYVRHTHVDVRPFRMEWHRGRSGPKAVERDLARAANWALKAGSGFDLT